MDGERMLDLLRSMDYERVSGTEGEMRGLEVLKSTCESFGLKAELEEFAVPTGIVSQCALEVTEPYQKSYPVRAYLRCQSVNAEAEILYGEDALEVNLLEAKGKILLINGGINKDNYERLAKSGAVCVVTGCGNSREPAENVDIRQAQLKPSLADKHGKFSAVMVRSCDLLEMIESGAQHARIVIESRDAVKVSHNLVATIPGTAKEGEDIVLTAHCDTTEFSHGMYDNAAGCAFLMEVARYFTANPPKRTLRLVWCGSEEEGLLGSKAYVGSHKDELEKIRLCINFDLGGNIAGHEFAIVTGAEDLTRYLDISMKTNGYAVEVRTDTYSSDNMPFADAGIPAVSIGRFGAGDMSYIHDRYDRIQYVSAKALAVTAERALMFTREMANAVCFPVKREIPEEMKKKVNEYMGH